MISRFGDRRLSASLDRQPSFLPTCRLRGIGWMRGLLASAICCSSLAALAEPSAAPRVDNQARIAATKMDWPLDTVRARLLVEQALASGRVTPEPARMAAGVDVAHPLCRLFVRQARKGFGAFAITPLPRGSMSVVTDPRVTFSVSKGPVEWANSVGYVLSPIGQRGGAVAKYLGSAEGFESLLFFARPDFLPSTWGVLAPDGPRTVNDTVLIFHVVRGSTGATLSIDYAAESKELSGPVHGHLCRFEIEKLESDR